MFSDRLHHGNIAIKISVNIQFEGQSSGIMKTTGLREQILDRTLAIKPFCCLTIPVAKSGHVQFTAKQWPERERPADESSPMTTEPMFN